MNVLATIILGSIEGITEFLPISSTAHLLLASRLLRLEESEFAKSFVIAIQCGAIASVIVLQWRRLFLERAVMLRIAAAFLPAVILGLIAHGFIKKFLFEDLSVILWSLFLGGIFLIAFERLHGEKEGARSDLGKIPLSHAVGIGIFQTLAFIPGVSRAGATVVGGLLLGLSRPAIVEFSFLLAVPTMLAATALDLSKTAPSFSENDLLLLFIGIAVSFLVALVSIRWFATYVQRHSFSIFGIYRIAAALIFWVLLQ